MNWKRIHMVLSKDHTLKDLYSYTAKTFQEWLHLPNQKAEQLYEDLHRYSPITILPYFKKNNIIPITIFDESYPKLLTHIYDPPFVLYAKGNVNSLKQEKRISIVGTREPTRYGLQALSTIIPRLVEHNITIVSGLAKGIDTYSHQLAIKHHGTTIAVLGSGFNYPYPKENEHLMTKMAEDHLLLTEYPPHIPPKRWHFPKRNRIISGLSHAVFVVEAKEKSGSLITADQALEQGRDVFALPGSIFQETSVGTNRLIQQGAKLVLTVEDILNEINHFCG